ncbi:hypothetical protein niasHS_015547 [Heterodera schachtii]|uniref:B30.2/SPRY domain-containing protein n=1 Tax=Heterodera schachtii TaxID=97005 RepID=A0ABD2HZH7_HETSC
MLQNENDKRKNDRQGMEEKMDKLEEQLEKNLEEMQKKLVKMEQQQNEQHSIEQMEKMLQNENDKRKNDRQGMEEKMDKLEEKLDTKAFQEEIEKKVMERIDVTVQTKVDKMEMAHQQQKVVTEKAIFERIGELEGQQKHQKQQGEKETNASEERFSQLQNCQKKLEKEQKQLQKENIDSWRSVFAKYPIVLNKHLSDFFYYEISVMKKEEYWVMFGFAVKQQQNELDGPIRTRKGTYGYDSVGNILINGQVKGMNAEYSYGDGDTVGIGLNLTSRQMIFTKNGLHLATSGLFDSSFADGSFYPFVSLFNSGDKIEANFGPNFKFDLETL